MKRLPIVLIALFFFVFTLPVAAQETAEPCLFSPTELVDQLGLIDVCMPLILRFVAFE